MASIAVAPPAAGVAAFQARIRLRLQELSADLHLPSVPDVDWRDPVGPEPLLWVSGRPLQPPLPQRDAPRPEGQAAAEAAAERVAGAVIRHRWLFLKAAGLPPRPALRDLSLGGLTLPELETLHRVAPADDVALALTASTRHPPRAWLLLNRQEYAAADGNALTEVAATLADEYGVPVAVPSVTPDAGLAPGYYRLRIGAVRDAVQRMTCDTAMRRALRSALPAFLDAGALLKLLLDAERVPPEMARAALREVDAPRMAAALRRLLADGIGLADPLLLCEAVTAAATPLGNPGERAVALPGTLVLADPASSDETELERRLRARLVPAHLLRRGVSAKAGEQGIAMWQLGRDALATLRGDVVPEGWVFRFAMEAAKVSERGVLVVPPNLRRRVRNLLTDALPELLVADGRELPTGSAPRLRGIIEVRSQA